MIGPIEEEKTEDEETSSKCQSNAEHLRQSQKEDSIDTYNLHNAGGMPSNSHASRGTGLEEEQILMIEDNMIATPVGQVTRKTDTES